MSVDTSLTVGDDWRVYLAFLPTLFLFYSIYVCLHAMRDIQLEQRLSRKSRLDHDDESTVKISIMWLNKFWK